MAVRTTGLDAYVRELQQGADAAGTYRLDVSNPTEYAAALQDRDGYEVIDEAHLAETADEHVRAVERSGLPVTRARIKDALDAAGFAEINHLRSLTGDTTDDGRQRHPGHWADETGLLANGYSHEVTG